MIALVTCAAARHLDTDLALLAAEMPDAEIVVWDDAAIEWGRFDAVIVRSTWDYHERRDEFVAWARRVESLAPLWNPADVIAWNTDKRYLAELAATVPVIATQFVAPGERLGHDEAIDLGGDVVVKPSIGAGSHGVVRSRGEPATVAAHVRSLHAAGRTAMVQPYVTAIDARGETGLVYLNGAFSHAFGKAAILTRPIAWEGGLFAAERTERRQATVAERALGDRVMSKLPPTAYARIDLVPGPDGPLVLEVELTEPSLFLDCDEGAPARAAAAFRSLAE